MPAEATEGKIRGGGGKGTDGKKKKIGAQVRYRTRTLGKKAGVPLDAISTFTDEELEGRERR